MTLLREIVKDLEDLKGDSWFGCKTLPMVWGDEKNKTFHLWPNDYFRSSGNNFK